MKQTLIWITIGLLLSCKEKEDPVYHKGEVVFSYTHIEDDTIADGTRLWDEDQQLYYTGWSVYEDIIFPNTTIEWSMEHSPDIALAGNSLKCAITGGDEYNNVFYTNTKALRWEGDPWKYRDAAYLEYALDLYIAGVLNCSEPDQATIEGMELTWQHILIPYSHGFGVQFSKGGEWRYWNDNRNLENKPVGWQSFSPVVKQCLTPNEWHHILLEGYISDNQIVYKTLAIDDKTFDLSSVRLPYTEATAGWVENFLQIGMQINGNRAVDATHGHGVDPVAVYIDNVTFKGYTWVKD